MNQQVEHFPLILLVGGQSSRMGTAKGLLNYQGKSWLTEQLDRFSAAGGKRAVVVLGYRKQEYLDAISWLEGAMEEPFRYNGVSVSVVLNRYPELGPFSTIQAGARLLVDEESAGAYVLPIDVPAPVSATWQALADVAGEQGGVCLPRCAERGGHPVLLTADFLKVLVAQPLDGEDSRLDRQIKKLDPRSVKRVVVDDPSISLNLNTPERWQGYLELMEQK